MSFFKRLTNLSKGLVLSKMSSSADGNIVDEELDADAANPTPSADARAELARLKATKPDPAEVQSEASESQDKGEPSGGPRKTL